MKKCDKIKHKMNATQKKCDMKRKQEEAAREKVRHEKSARMKYAKKNTQEQWTRVHKRMTGHPLTDRYTLVQKNPNVFDLNSLVYKI